VGAGYWARSAHVASLAGEKGATFTAVTSANLASARALADEAGIASVLEDWHTLVRSDDVDAVVVAAPAPLHRPVTLAALDAGKHVLCEAPLGCDASEAREMLAAAEASGRVHAYVRPRPFLYGGAEVCRLVASGAIGEPESATFAWHDTPWLAADPAHTWRTRAGMGPPVLLGVTMAVVIATLGPVSRVRGELGRVGPAPASGLDAAPDSLSGTLWTARGTEVAVRAGRLPHDALEAESPADGLTVHGSEGVLSWTWGPQPRVQITRAGREVREDVPCRLDADLGRAWPFTRDFVAAIRDGRAAVPDFRAGVDELAAVDAFLRSSDGAVEVGPTAAC
jgi:predicted dehydrogenase